MLNPSLAEAEFCCQHSQLSLSSVHMGLDVLWSTECNGYVRDCDIKAVMVLPYLKDGEDEEPLEDDSDLITYYVQ